MKPLRIGVVGTSGIAHEFCQALQLLKLEPALVYSRTNQRGQDFVKPYQAKATTEFSDLFSCDWVYIASPNEIHFGQAQQLLKQAVPCLIEKPMVLRNKELQVLRDIAAKKKVFFLEAFRHLHNPALSKISQLLKNQKVKKAYFEYCKRSSRLLPNGELVANASVFSKKLGGGALNDLGVYCLSLAISFFGTPLRYKIRVNSCLNEVDVDTIAVLDYSGFQVETRCAKTFDHSNRNQIIFQNGVILDLGDDGYTFQNCFYQNQRITKALPGPTDFIYEISKFQEMIICNDESFFRKYLAISAATINILDFHNQ